MPLIVDPASAAAHSGQVRFSRGRLEIQILAAREGAGAWTPAGMSPAEPYSRDALPYGTALSELVQLFVRGRDSFLL
ncbi:hypothetical protein ACWEQG_22845 [Microbispora sp. NPDC004025]